MFRKTMIVAAAIGAVGMAMGPGNAGASWGHMGEAIQENYVVGELGLTGSMRFQSEMGGIECQTTAKLLLEPGTTGTLSALEPDTASSGTPTNRCKGLGGLAFCQVHQFSPTGLPWAIHTASATTISIATGEMHTSTTGGFCPVKAAVVTPAALTGTVDKSAEIGSFQLSGSIQADLQTTSETVDKFSATVSGLLGVTGPGAATYEI